MSLATYIHPVVGGIVIAGLLYVASLGLRARNDRRRAAMLLDRHSRLAPVMYALALISWLGGVASTWWWRRDLELFTSAHFRIGCAMTACLTAGWFTSLLIRQPWSRSLHPWFGVAAVLLAAAQVFFGLQITP